MLAKVTGKRVLSADMTGLVLEIGDTSGVNPGMFAHIKVPGAPQLLLRRPISIMDADQDEGTVLLGIRPQGEGTRLIAQIEISASMDVLLPLGNGFSPGNARTLWLVGGGVGVAPLCYCAHMFAGHAKTTAILGYRTSDHVYGTDLFERYGAETVICTDDGSCGVHGLVTEAFVGRALPDMVMACGPTPMLRAVKRFCQEAGVACQLSLEQRMGCGYGACLTCSCEGEDEKGRKAYLRVCADGPVFLASEVTV